MHDMCSLADISPAKLQEWFGEWQDALGSKGLKVNADKTETMLCAKTAVSADNWQTRQDSEANGDLQIPG